MVGEAGTLLLQLQRMEIILYRLLLSDGIILGIRNIHQEIHVS